MLSNLTLNDHLRLQSWFCFLHSNHVTHFGERAHWQHYLIMSCLMGSWAIFLFKLFLLKWSAAATQCPKITRIFIGGATATVGHWSVTAASPPAVVKTVAGDWWGNTLCISAVWRQRVGGGSVHLFPQKMAPNSSCKSSSSKGVPPLVSFSKVIIFTFYYLGSGKKNPFNCNWDVIGAIFVSKKGLFSPFIT